MSDKKAPKATGVANWLQWGDSVVTRRATRVIPSAARNRAGLRRSIGAQTAGRPIPRYARNDTWTAHRLHSCLVTTPSPAPVPPRRDGAATRQRLLRAALELFTTNGFLATTTPEIAAKAGVAEGTIYRHFSGKEELLVSAYRESQGWGLALIKIPAGDNALPSQDRLLSVGRQLVGAAQSDPAMTRMLLRRRDERYLDDAGRQAAREFREALQQIVASGKSDGLVRPGPADLWTAVWLALVAFTTERVSSGEWTPEHPQVALTLGAAWDAISTTKSGSGEEKT
jgi:TetR/AcrR family transcriptional regulator, repressor of fatR-cypB operon